MQLYRRLDRAWVRCEGVLTVIVLLSMVFIACFSAGIRNLTRWDVAWANAILTDMAWVDSFLNKATTLLAFLGASQATFYRKHIGIDVLTRIAPLRPRYAMHAASNGFAAIIALGLTFSLGSAVRLNLVERPIEYELLGDSGPMHVCDARPDQLARLIEVERPSLFCGVRSVLAWVGMQPETPGAAFQTVVPLLFLIMSVRFAAIGIEAAIALKQGDAALERLEAEERARLLAVHEGLNRASDRPELSA